MTYEQLESRIATWSENQPDIRAVIVVGSRARGDADRWSDLDLLLFTRDRARYADPAWLQAFGDVWLTYLDQAGPGDPEWFAIYDGGLKVDIVLIQVEDSALNLETLLRQFPYQAVFARGIKVLFDQYEQARSVPPKTVDQPEPPSAAIFDHVVSGFLLESITTAKFIARGDYWRAQHWVAHDLRPRLLKLIEWHAYGQDTWYDGRFIDAWADSRILSMLPQTFALYKQESLIMALKTMLDLFRLLGEESAARFNFTYPLETHHKVTQLISSLSGNSRDFRT
jgi:aminoglycoside 6-adenylyltransferase